MRLHQIERRQDVSIIRNGSGAVSYLSLARITELTKAQEFYYREEKREEIMRAGEVSVRCEAFPTASTASGES